MLNEKRLTQVIRNEKINEKIIFRAKETTFIKAKCSLKSRILNNTAVIQK